MKAYTAVLSTDAPVAAQIPHFFALAWLCRADYARAGFRMLTVLNPSGHRVGEG